MPPEGPGGVRDTHELRTFPSLPVPVVDSATRVKRHTETRKRAKTSPGWRVHIAGIRIFSLASSSGTPERKRSSHFFPECRLTND